MHETQKRPTVKTVRRFMQQGLDAQAIKVVSNNTQGKN
jgi:uncharacterized protein YoaH (UPF0181 family)